MLGDNINETEIRVNDLNMIYRFSICPFYRHIAWCVMLTLSHKDKYP